MKLKKLFVSLLVMLLFAQPLYADWINSPQRGHRGWYGYEPLKKKKKKKKPKQAKQKSKQTPIRWPTLTELYHMKIKDIRHWIDRASDEAISNPTDKNIKRWIEYMRVADRKATEFAGMWAWVMQNNPDLYRQSALYPSVNPGNRAYWKLVWKGIEDTLRTKADTYALIFFYSDDPFSKAQGNILDIFREENPGWIVKEVKVTPEVARKYRINYTPQIWLLSKRMQKPIPLAAGVISVNTLEKKIYHTILVLEGKMPPKLAPYEPFKIRSVK